MVSGALSPTHLLLLAIVVMALFGAKRLPEFGKSLGSGMRGFKDALDGRDGEDPKRLD